MPMRKKYIGKGVGGTFRAKHNFSSQGNRNYLEWNIVQHGLRNRKKKAMTDINCTTRLV